MTDFFDNFKSDKFFDDRILWVTLKPVFADAHLRYEFHSLGVNVVRNPRRAYKRVDVYAHNALGNGYHKHQEIAWGYLATHSASIEKAVAKKLWPICLDNFEEFLKYISDSDKTWAAIQNQESWKDQPILSKQIILTGISLYDTAIDGCGVFTLDFAVGWDEEHGVSVLMHRNKVIATSTLADFTGRGDTLLDHAKCIQESNYTDGDLRL